MKKTVCLIGRPNVGKSTIFNKLIRENKSIIMDTPGVTRDRIYGNVNYGNYSFLLIDTGGIDLGEENFYTKYQGQLGIVTSISYDKKDFVFGVKFENGDHIDFKASELEKIQPEDPLRYKKLNIEY